MAGKLTSVSVKQGAGHNLMAPSEFVRMPVSTRIRLLMEQKVVFLDEEGQPIEPQDAVGQLPKVTIGPAR